MHHQKIHASFSMSLETDLELDARAPIEGVKKPELIVEYIAQGLAMPDSVPLGDQAATPAPPEQGSLTVRRIVYIDSNLRTALSSRASSENVAQSRLVDRFCLEGLARPPTGGLIATKAKERLIAFHKARVAHFREIADEAAKTLAEEITKFQRACPHVRIVGTSDGLPCGDLGCIHDHPGRLCDDCGLYETSCGEPEYRTLSGPARTVSGWEFASLARAHPYRFRP